MIEHKFPLESALGLNKELFQRWQFPHPGDYYLIMVLCRVGHKPSEGIADTRGWVTWYYNSDSGGFNDGHYFEHNEERGAQEDFLQRCMRNIRIKTKTVV